MTSDIETSVYSRRNINLPSLNGATSYSHIKNSSKISMTPQSYNASNINEKLKVDKSVDYLLQMRNKREANGGGE